MIITHEREKLINAIVYFAKNTRNFGIIKLNKLLYFLDFYHYRDTGRSVTGLQYYAWKMGPVPTDIYDELRSSLKEDLASKVYIKTLPIKNKSPMQLVQAIAEFDPTHFTKRELRLLEDLSNEYRDAKADAMIADTHLENRPWHQVYEIEKRIQAIIPYEYAFRKSEQDFMPSVAQENKEIIHNYQ